MAQMVKNSSATYRSEFNPWVRKTPLEKGKATYSSILDWRIPWTEMPCSLQSMGPQRVGHDVFLKAVIAIISEK